MMIVIHHCLTTASKPAAKHAKPSSLKYADTTNRDTDRKYRYIYLFIYSIEKVLGGGKDQRERGDRSTESVEVEREEREHQGSEDREEK